MVPGSFSRFILVQWTRPTLKYANYMVHGSFSHFVFVHWTRPTLKYENYMVSGSFSRFNLVCRGLCNKHILESDVSSVIC